MEELSFVMIPESSPPFSDEDDSSEDVDRETDKSEKLVKHDSWLTESDAKVTPDVSNFHGSSKDDRIKDESAASESNVRQETNGKDTSSDGVQITGDNAEEASTLTLIADEQDQEGAGVADGSQASPYVRNDASDRNVGASDCAGDVFIGVPNVVDEHDNMKTDESAEPHDDGDVRIQSVEEKQASGRSSLCSSRSNSIDDPDNQATLDRWKRCILIHNVPEQYDDMLYQLLEDRKIGGAKLNCYERYGNDTLAMFEDEHVAKHFLKQGNVKLMKLTFKVTSPLIQAESMSLMRIVEIVDADSSSEKLSPVQELAELDSFTEHDVDNQGSTNIESSPVSHLPEDPLTAERIKDKEQAQQDNLEQNELHRASPSNYDLDSKSFESSSGDSGKMAFEKLKACDVFERTDVVDHASDVANKDENKFNKTRSHSPLIDKSDDANEVSWNTNDNENLFLDKQKPLSDSDKNRIDYKLDDIEKSEFDSIDTCQDTSGNDDRANITSASKESLPLLVKGIPKDCEEFVQTWLEATKKGGGELLLFDYDAEHGMAKVVYKDRTVAERQLDRGKLTVQNHDMVIEKFTDDSHTKTELPNNEDSLSIVVTDIPPGMEGFVEVFLESSKKGGGELLSFDYDPTQRVAKVIFKENEVAKSQLQKGRLIIQNHEMKITIPRGSVTENTEQKNIGSRPLLISNIPDSLQEDLEVWLEAKKNGGGEILLIDPNVAKKTAKVIFKDQQVAERLLQKEQFVLCNHKLTVTEYKEGSCSLPESESSSDEESGSSSQVSSTLSDDDSDEKKLVPSNVIQVTGIPEEMTRELLFLVFENKRLTGVTGRIESIQYIPGSGMAVIEFTSPEDAQAALKKKFIAYKSSNLAISRPSVSKKEDYEDKAKIEVCDIPSKLNEEILKMFFENNKRSGGGEIKSVEYDALHHKAIIEFADVTVAQSLITKGNVEFKGEEMRILRVESILSAASLAKDGDNQFKIVKVTSSKTGKQFTKEMLMLYFENFKRSSGGEIHDLKVIEEKKKAFIQFKDPQAALRVSRKTDHQLDGEKLQVIPREIAPSVASQAVLVTGVTRMLTTEIIELFFANEKRSKGGHIEEIFVADSSVVITFKDPAVAKRVAEQQKCVLNNVNLLLALMSPAPPPPIILGDIDTIRLLAKRLPVETKFDSLKKFLEWNESAAKVRTWTLCVKPTTVLLDFLQPPNYSALQHLVSRKPYCGTMISVQRVEQTLKVQVHRLKSTFTKDYIQLYFERYAKEEVVVEELNSDKNNYYAIVALQSQKGVSALLSMTHKLEDHVLHVAPYYPWMGIVSGSSEPEAPASLIPTIIKVECRLNALQFITGFPEIKKDVENVLAKANCAVQWPNLEKTSPANLIVTLAALEKTKLVPRWEEKGKALLADYLNDCKMHKFHVSPEIVEFKSSRKKVEFKVRVLDYVKVNKLQIRYEFLDDQTLVFMGFTKVASEFEKALSHIDNELKKARETKSYVLPYQPHQLKLLDMCPFLQDIKKGGKIKMEIGTDGKLILSGPDNDVMMASCKISENMVSWISETIEANDTVMKCLRNGETKKLVDQCFSKEKLIATWIIDNQSCKVLAINSEELKKASRVIKSQVVQRTLKVNEGSRHALSSEKWTTFVKSIIFEFQTLEIDVSEGGIAVTCIASHIDAVSKRVNEFFEGNTLVSETFAMDYGYFDLIRRYMSTDLAKINNRLKETGGELDCPISGPHAFKLSGTASAMIEAKKSLQELALKIVSAYHELESGFFDDVHGRLEIAALEQSHKVCIQVETKGAAAAAIPSSMPSSSYKLKAKTKLQSGQSILLVQGDMTKYKVDAIFCITDKELHHVGGIAEILEEAAGHDVKYECKMQDKHLGPLLPGQVFVSGRGDLPCEFIIHAYVPRWQTGDNNEPQHLHAAINASLEQASSRKLKSISLPATMQVKARRYPIDISRDIMLQAVGDFWKSKPESSLKEVHIICMDDDEVHCFDQEIQKVAEAMANSEEEHHQEGHQREGRRGTERASKRPAADIGSFISPKSAPGSSSQPGVIITKEGIKITLFKGSIVKLQVDAIVNTIGTNLDLSHGAVSKTILNTAGQAIQDDCRRLRPPTFQHGDLIETPGHQLPCRFVYHGSVKAWDNGAGESEKILRKFLRNILKQAHLNNLTSVAIPAIGTGQLHIPHAFCADVMYDELETFSKNNLATTVKDVRFVIYDQDKAGIDAFESKIQKLQAAQPNVARAASPAGSSSAADAAAGGAVGGATRGSARPKLGAKPKDIDITLTSLPYNPLQKTVIQIYALDDLVIDRVINELYAVLKAATVDVVMESKDEQEAIKNLTSEQVEEIQALASMHQVKIEIEKTKLLNRIRVRGPPAAVNSTIREINQIFRKVDKKQHKRNEAALVQGCWMYMDQESFEVYPDEINVIIEKAYLNKKPYAEWMEANVHYTLDFKTMKEGNNGHSNKIPVKRTIKDLLPSNWSKMSDAENLKIVELSRQDKEYKDVEKNARASAGTTINQILKIMRIQNRQVFRQYIVTKDDMEANKKATQIEKTLWHGTAVSNVQKINEIGFNRVYSGANATLYGKGTYFAVDFQYSANASYSPPDASGIKHIYQSKVLTGEFTVGSADLKEPPKKTPPAVGSFDSVVDNMTSPQLFVVFFDAQAYPEYLIYFN